MSGKGKQETRSREECLWEVERHLDYRLSIPVSLDKAVRIIPTGAKFADDLALDKVTRDEALQIERFCNAVDLLESSAIVLKNKETHAFRVIRPAASSRYTEKGRKRSQKRVRSRLQHNRGGEGLFLTLTIAPRKMTREKAWQGIGHIMSDFIDRINKHRKDQMTKRNKDIPKDQRRKYRRLTYIWTLEEQPGTGYPHIHMFFPWLKYLEEEKEVERLWGYGLIDLRKGCANISNYITKYITKMEGWSLLGLSYLWEFRRRLYSFSRKFSIPGEKKEPMYELIGAFNKAKGFGIYVEGKGYTWVGNISFEWLFDTGEGGVIENPGAAEYLREVLWTEEVKASGNVIDIRHRVAVDHAVARSKVGRAYRNGRHLRKADGKANGWAAGWANGTVATGQEKITEGVC